MGKEIEPGSPAEAPRPKRDRETHDPPYEIDPPAPPRPARPDGEPTKKPEPPTPGPDIESSRGAATADDLTVDDPDSHEVVEAGGTLLGPFFDDIVGSASASGAA